MVGRALYLLVDRSTSMNCPVAVANDRCGLLGEGVDPPEVFGDASRWSRVVAAIERFTSSPDAAAPELGLGFFPARTFGATGICDAATYSFPDVPLQAEPNAGRLIGSVLLANPPGGGTPTAPALAGAIEYARAVAQQGNGQREVAVVLLTDGIPTLCDGSSAALVNAANAGVVGSPSVLTFVIGVGPELDVLGDVARAGGTASARLLDPSIDWSAQLNRTLDEVSNECE